MILDVFLIILILYFAKNQGALEGRIAVMEKIVAQLPKETAQEITTEEKAND